MNFMEYILESDKCFFGVELLRAEFISHDPLCGFKQRVVEVIIHSCGSDEQRLQVADLAINVDVWSEILVLIWVHIKMNAGSVSIVVHSCNEL